MYCDPTCLVEANLRNNMPFGEFHDRISNLPRPPSFIFICEHYRISKAEWFQADNVGIGPPSAFLPK
jgi:hypothetical protein